MTVDRLYKILGQIIADGCGRRLVAVDKTSFHDNRENDGCTILPISGVMVYPVPQADDDGGHAINKDGSERYRSICVLYGCMGSSSHREKGQ